MNDEIKEILDYLTKFINDKEEITKYGCEISVKQAKQLLDYITNLQQENEDNMKCIKSVKEQLESVINENQRLLNKWFENNDKMVELIGEKEVYNESLKDYKSRIEKAVEYIKQSMNESQLIFGWNDIQRYHDNEMKELLNILNGKE